MRSPFSRFYDHILIGSETFSLARDWKWLLAWSAAAYATVVLLHMLDLPNWSHPLLSVGGEHIMSTHDTYYWLAGAEGVGRAASSPMAALARVLAGLTGSGLGQVGFWAPPFFAGLVAVATLFWGWLLAGRVAGLAAGFVAALAPGFFFRTRLGYFDTDMFTLLAPLAAAWMAAYIAGRYTRPGWLAHSAAAEEGQPPARIAWLALGFGLAARFGGIWHANIVHLNMLVLWAVVLATTVTARPGSRTRALLTLAVFALAAFPGADGAFDFWRGLVGLISGDQASAFASALFFLTVRAKTAHCLAGPVLAAALALALQSPRGLRSLERPVLAAVVLTLVVLESGLLSPVVNFALKLAIYLKPVSEAAGAGGAGPIYPAIAQSVREAVNMPWPTVFWRMSSSSWTGVLGLAGFVALVGLRPLALPLAVPLVLALSSRWLGLRFDMFGGPALALGLGLGCHWLCKGLVAGRPFGGRVLVGLQLALAGALLAPLAVHYAGLRPTPVLAKPHAEALLRLKDLAPAEAEVWTWWDYGYATQYYARRMTPSDGGRHSGRDIYPTALALNTDSPRRAARLIRYSAARGNDPARAWDRMPAKEVEALINGLGGPDLGGADLDLPAVVPQYLVVCWENLDLAHWITFYGSWDLVSGRGEHGRINFYRQKFRFNSRAGLVDLMDGNRPVPVSSVKILGGEGDLGRSYIFNFGPHMLVNAQRMELALMDDRVYGSMLVRLLVGDPGDEDISRWFRLVIDDSPNVRIYEVL
ncbi:MAG: STT3 domain-containing protein [Desulfovibrionaceae bacterium]|nr:STT3 domain-containing protein [Desulfovibrionaceae bacterium]